MKLVDRVLMVWVVACVVGLAVAVAADVALAKDGGLYLDLLWWIRR